MDSAYHALKITNSQVGIYNSRFLNLQHDGNGGAIVWHDNSNGDSDIAIVNTVFENTGGYVGGAIIANDTSGSLALDCVTFTNNESSSRGGAIGTEYFDGTITIQNSNFINNYSQNGGALHLMGGTVTFEKTYWSPAYSDTPTAPNSIINTGGGGINFIGASAFSPNIGNCYVPPPSQSHSDECLAEISSTVQLPDGFTIRNIPRDDPNSSSITARLSPGTDVKILGRNIGVVESGEAYWWWWVDYNGIIGWVRQDGIRTIGGGCEIYSFDRVPIVDYVSGTYNQGNMVVNVISYNLIHDYPLDVPEYPLYNTIPLPIKRRNRCVEESVCR